MSDEAEIFIDFEPLDSYQPALDEAWHDGQIEKALQRAGIRSHAPLEGYDELERVMLRAGRDVYQSDTRFLAGPVGKRYRCEGDCCCS